jgi:hypothetical protein
VYQRYAVKNERKDFDWENDKVIFRRKGLFEIRKVIRKV